MPRQKGSYMDAGNTPVRGGNGDDKPRQAADVGLRTAPQTNFERLIAHLAKDSLAARLVTAYAMPGELKPADAVAKVATRRLDGLKRSYGKSKNQED